MQPDQFRQAVKSRLAIDDNSYADEVIEAVLSTLSMRINSDEAEHLAAQLPEPYKTYVGSVGGQESFDLDEFFERVAGKLRLGRGPAIRYAQGVMNVLNEAVTRGELTNILSQLPADYEMLFETSAR